MRLTRLSDDQEIAIGQELSEKYSANPERMSPEEQLSRLTYSA